MEQGSVLDATQSSEMRNVSSVFLAPLVYAAGNRECTLRVGFRCKCKYTESPYGVPSHSLELKLLLVLVFRLCVVDHQSSWNKSLVVCEK